MSLFPVSTWQVKAIFEPSGDHIGKLGDPRPTLLSNNADPLPSTLTTYRPPEPKNAIFEPSGDHESPVRKSVVEMGRPTTPVPSKFITHTTEFAGAPAQSLDNGMNAMRTPSGDQAG